MLMPNKRDVEGIRHINGNILPLWSLQKPWVSLAFSLNHSDRLSVLPGSLNELQGCDGAVTFSN